MAEDKSDAANKINQLSHAGDVPFVVESVARSGLVTFQLNAKEKLDKDGVEPGSGEAIASLLHDLYDNHTVTDVDTHFSGIRIKALFT